MEVSFEDLGLLGSFEGNFGRMVEDFSLPLFILMMFRLCMLGGYLNPSPSSLSILPPMVNVAVPLLLLLSRYFPSQTPQPDVHPFIKV